MILRKSSLSGLKSFLYNGMNIKEERCVVPLQPELGEYIEATKEQMPENAWIEYES